MLCVRYINPSSNLPFHPPKLLLNTSHRTLKQYEKWCQKALFTTMILPAHAVSSLLAPTFRSGRKCQGSFRGMITICMTTFTGFPFSSIRTVESTFSAPFLQLSMILSQSSEDNVGNVGNVGGSANGKSLAFFGLGISELQGWPFVCSQEFSSENSAWASASKGKVTSVTSSFWTIKEKTGKDMTFEVRYPLKAQNATGSKPGNIQETSWIGLLLLGTNLTRILVIYARWFNSWPFHTFSILFHYLEVTNNLWRGHLYNHPKKGTSRIARWWYCPSPGPNGCQSYMAAVSWRPFLLQISHQTKQTKAKGKARKGKERKANKRKNADTDRKWMHYPTISFTKCAFVPSFGYQQVPLEVTHWSKWLLFAGHKKIQLGW